MVYRREITDADAVAAAQHHVRVMTTLGWLREEEYAKQRDMLFRDVIRPDLTLLRQHGVPILIGSDQFRQTSAPEAQDLVLVVGFEWFLVLALRSMRAGRATSRTFVEVVAIATPIALLLAALGRHLPARVSLAPLVAMTASAESIGASNLDGRLAVSNPQDEHGELATVINGLLVRLEQAFGRQRQFMTDDSHGNPSASDAV